MRAAHMSRFGASSLQRVSTVAMLSVISLGCGSGDVGGAADAGGDGGAAAVSDAQKALVGAFQVKLVPATGTAKARTTVLGSVKDGPTPVLVNWKEQASSGDCKLLVPDVPVCDPACAGEACVGEGSCQAYPKSVDVGAVDVHGLATSAGDKKFQMSAIGGFYQPAGVTLQHPAVAEGGDIRVVAAGSGDIAPFELATKGIAALELTSEPIALDGAKSRKLTWKAPAVTGSSVDVKVDISHHGGTKGLVTCETDDDGELELAGALLKGLFELGVAGFPAITVTRSRTATTPQGRGDVRLAVVSAVQQDVVVPGVISCNSDADCPKGRACSNALLKCE